MRPRLDHHRLFLLSVLAVARQQLELLSFGSECLRHVTRYRCPHACECRPVSKVLLQFIIRVCDCSRAAAAHNSLTTMHNIQGPLHGAAPITDVMDGVAPQWEGRTGLQLAVESLAVHKLTGGCQGCDKLGALSWHQP